MLQLVSLSVCLFVWWRIFHHHFCIVVLYLRPSLFFLACLNIESKNFLDNLNWISRTLVRFLVASVLVAEVVHFLKICFMVNTTPDPIPRHVYQALPVGCAHFSPSLNTPTDNRLAGDRFWRVLCVFNWLIVFCWFLSKKKRASLDELLVWSSEQ